MDIVVPDGELDEPTDHPHVGKQRAPLLDDDADPDVERYTLSIKGRGASVRFFKSLFLENLDDDLYGSHERGEMGNFTMFGIVGDDIWDVIAMFNAVAREIDEIKITGVIDGEEYEMEAWDGEVRSEPLLPLN